MVRIHKLVFAALLACQLANAFLMPNNRASTSVQLRSSNEDTLEKVQKDLQSRFKIFTDSLSGGVGFKQTTANVIAGEYDAASVKAELESIIKSAPCVMFTWEASPSCKKAVRAFDIVGADVKYVRLDDPWDEGNVLRAELGKMVGRTSMPSIWMGGLYVGGYDGGVSDEAPGLVDMAFKGTLLPRLEKIGALKKSSSEETSKQLASSISESQVDKEQQSASSSTDSIPTTPPPAQITAVADWDEPASITIVADW
mmetsp:Transcript_5875/g.10164  ORF Transcript_5875/g.10164 Transcript_5875/m.10164 type:complete len:255 (+) Transcript_5875:22-786(+)|eukprot:CAMPEP_0194583170 /NCGR_PEP_ID=MMETSP0292-20121207/16142_1 /TAXON_ID=39354 /ORGANISM="Heterosigma akashiwo, Strain CCMP2393" /LENGTH=254 /DNA_ID=CAMNT_0039437665 /DNA_START=30 /DNA_END=794 /DNA_ORIENTATION=-